jgi:hypothetical protein
MKSLLTSILILFAMNNAQAGDHDPKVIIPHLKYAKMTLLEGIGFAEKTSGAATSAKYEVGDGKLILSIYTVPEGLGVEPEKATLTEISGVATEVFKPSTEVFTDKEHIARSAVHMTLMQQSPFTLKQVVNLALKRVAGVPIDIRNPMIRGKRPVADVVVVDAKEQAFIVTVDLLTGKTTVNP